MSPVLRQRSDAESAHRAAVSETLDELTSFLIDLLGASLVAFITEVDDTTVRRWANGQNSPQAQSERRLRATAQIARLLLGGDANHTVRAWFIGMNPQLDDDSPAEALQQDRMRDAMAAAKAFMAGA